MAIPLSEALVLGVAQGIAEFLPISSDGHFMLARMLFGGGADATMSLFLHLGVLGAALLVLRRPVGAALVEGLRGVVRPSLLEDTPGGRDAVIVALVTVPALVVGLGLLGPAEAWASSPVVVGSCLLGSALAIGSTHWAPKGDLETPTRWGALLVGVAEGAAVLPGLSRTGVTIATLLWLGVRSERAFELSLLASIPAIVVAEILGARHGLAGDPGVLAMVLGAFVALGAGAASLRLLRDMVTRRSVAVFAIYLVPVGLATLAWGYARP